MAPAPMLPQLTTAAPAAAAHRQVLWQLLHPLAALLLSPEQALLQPKVPLSAALRRQLQAVLWQPQAALRQHQAAQHVLQAAQALLLQGPETAEPQTP